MTQATIRLPHKFHAKMRSALETVSPIDVALSWRQTRFSRRFVLRKPDSTIDEIARLVAYALSFIPEPTKVRVEIVDFGLLLIGI